MSVKINLLLSTFLISMSPAFAADKYSTGDITWDTSTAVWSLTAGGTYDQLWVDGDTAIFEGAGGGTVTLGEDINLSHLNIATNDYTLTGNKLIFAPSGTITNTGLMVTLSCGITGAPEFYAAHPNGWGGAYGANGLFLSPTSSDMEIGTLHFVVENYMEIGGSTIGNTIMAMPRTGAYRNKMRWKGPGTWTVSGECYSGEFYIDGGTLITGGWTYTDYRYITPVNGATFVVNGTLQDLTFTGGTVKGTGTIEVAVVVPASGILSPGDPMGTLSITGTNCAINGTLAIQVDGAQNGLLAVAAPLAIGSATLDATALSTPSSPLVIATYTSLVGTFATTNLPGSGWSVDYAYEGNQIALTPPPGGTVVILR